LPAGRLEFAAGEIVDLLKRAGHEPKRKIGPDKYMFFCVFHADGHDPNMSVNAQKNVFHCFACPEEGGVVDLARHLDVEYRTSDGVSHRVDEKRGRGRPSNDQMWKEWATALWTEDGAEALAVLRARGLTDETLRAHNIGVTHRLWQNEVSGGWRITIPVFDETGGVALVRRYHPEGRLRRYLETVAMVDDPSRASAVKSTKDEQTAPCPAADCGYEIVLTPAHAETEIACPGCHAKLRVNAKRTKIWSSGDSTIYGRQMLADMRRRAAEDPSAPLQVVVTEGEWKRLRLLQNGIPAVCGTSGAGTWKPEWTALFDGLEIAIAYDVDRNEAGQKGAAKVARSMQERSRIRALKVVHLPFRDDDRLPSGGRPKDVDDWFTLGHTADELLALIDVAEPLALPRRSEGPPRVGEDGGGDGGGVGGGAGAAGGDGGNAGGLGTRPPSDLIDEIREIGKELPAFRKRRLIWEIVRASLYTRGRFMRTREKDYYFFDTGERRLHVVCNEEMMHFLQDNFRLNATEQEFKFVVAELEGEASRRGELVRVRRFCHWVRDTNLLYISQFDGRVARISDSSVEVVPNGTDGVVFLDSPEDCDPWTFSAPPGSPMPLDQAIAEIMRYVADVHFDAIRCPPDIAQKLLLLWIVSVFFGAGIKTRPICTFVGEKGSGKSLTFQRFLQLCFGPDAEVTSVRHDNQDDMQAAVMSNFLVVFDNVDNEAEFLNDELAKIATGMKIVRRRLYSTLGTQSFRPDCFVGISTQAPHFTRSDVIDRMLLFRVSRREEFGIVPTIGAADRSRFFSAIASLAMPILAAVRDGKRPSKAPYRLADWSTMAFLIGTAIGWPADDCEALMSATEWMRIDLQADEDPIPDMVGRWISESDLREGRVYRPVEIVTEWNAMLEKERSKIRYHAKWIGRKIKDALPALEKRWKVTISHDDKENVDLFCFDRRKNIEDQKDDLLSYMEGAKRAAVMHGGGGGGADDAGNPGDGGAADGGSGSDQGGSSSEGSGTKGADEQTTDSFADDDDDVPF